MSEIKNLEKRLAELDLASKKIERERGDISGRLKLLQAKESSPALHTVPLEAGAGRPIIGIPVSQSAPVTPDEKVDLFLKLFRCRESLQASVE